jgi:hypothetical protein
MDDLRGSLSKFKKDVKHQFGRSRRKGDKPGPSGREESVGPSSSLPQPESRASTGGGREQEGGGPNVENENVGAGGAADENRPDWKSTASSSAKLVLRAVRDSADAFPPLKSVAGGLCSILENYEVRCFPLWVVSNAYVSAENKGEQTDDRIVGTPGRKARRTALQVRQGGRCRRTREKNETGTVSAHSPRTTKRRV